MIAFDYDGVINNICPMMAERASAMLGRRFDETEIGVWSWPDSLPISREQRDELYSIYVENESAIDTPFYEGALEFLRWLQVATPYPVVIVTARAKYSDTPTLIRNKLVAAGLNSSKLMVYGRKEKGKLLKDLHVQYFVDDYLGNLVQVANHGIFPIIQDRPWNQLGCGTEFNCNALRINNLNELRPLVRNARVS